MLVPVVPSKRILLLLDATTALVSQRVDSFVLALLMVLSCRVGLAWVVGVRHTVLCIDPLKIVLSSLPMIDVIMDVACGGCNIGTLVRSTLSMPRWC